MYTCQYIKLDHWSIHASNYYRKDSKYHDRNSGGTGGDGKNTFNISTTTALVLAAMGKKVIKHGNYGVSSMCGSSNVLEELGFEFKTNSEELNRELDENNILLKYR
mgnify:CR=1 FL=1